MYWNTPHSTTGVSPAELFLNRRPRTQLDMLRPSARDQVFRRQIDQKKSHDRCCKAREFQVGQRVLVRNVRDGPKWVLGEVCGMTGPLSYEVSVGDQVWRRHVEQLLGQADHVYHPLECPDLAEIPEIPLSHESVPTEHGSKDSSVTSSSTQEPVTSENFSESISVSPPGSPATSTQSWGTSHSTTRYSLYSHST